MKPGDLVKSRFGSSLLYTDCEAQLLSASLTGDTIYALADEVMVFLGRGRFKYVRVLHPVHGPQRIHRHRLVPVLDEAR